MGGSLDRLQFHDGELNYIFTLELKLTEINASLQHTGVGNGGGGQQMAGPGSCLQDFRTNPFIECNGGKGHCHYYDTQNSFWLVTVEEHMQFQRPDMTTLKAGNLLSRVSRCQVCMKN